MVKLVNHKIQTRPIWLHWKYILSRWRPGFKLPFGPRKNTTFKWVFQIRLNKYYNECIIAKRPAHQKVEHVSNQWTSPLQISLYSNIYSAITQKIVDGYIATNSVVLYRHIRLYWTTNMLLVKYCTTQGRDFVGFYCVIIGIRHINFEWTIFYLIHRRLELYYNM